MFEALYEYLQQWNKQYSDRSKLQHTYAVAAVFVLILAGLIGLINYDLGQSLLFIAIVSILVFILNAVVWAILQSFVLSRVGKPRRTARTAKKK